MNVSSVVGLRDRAIIAVMTYTFARVGAVVALTVEDYFAQKNAGGCVSARRTARSMKCLSGSLSFSCSRCALLKISLSGYFAWSLFQPDFPDLQMRVFPSLTARSVFQKLLDKCSRSVSTPRLGHGAGSLHRTLSASGRVPYRVIPSLL